MQYCALSLLAELQNLSLDWPVQSGRARVLFDMAGVSHCHPIA